MASFGRTRPLLVCAVIVCAGCATTGQEMTAKGYPPHYADGFDDGCHSGRKAGGSLFDQFKKDVSRFERDSQYAQGWSDGFRQCETEQESAMRQARMAIEQQRLAEERKRNQDAKQRELEREALKGVDTSNLKSLK
jgi:hypothetical protein